MRFTYRDAEVFYKFIDRKKQITNVYLHGWGTSMQTLSFCEEHIQKQNSLYIDFPPFGKSFKNIKDWSVFTYANMVICLAERLKLEKINLIGHSFGGRISILIASMFKKNVEKLVLIDSAGIKPKRKLSYYIKVWRYKRKVKKGKDVSKYGSADYKMLSANMRKTFNSVVNTNLEPFLPMICAKTLIIFGQKDCETPISMAKKLNSNIKNSQLCIIKEAGHFCFNDKRFEFVEILRNFIEEV